MYGVLNINKPAGITSHDVVSRIRKIFKMKRVGHAGTLDPGATGVLLVCLGQATRISEFLMGSEKEYQAVLALGIETSTEDGEGEVTSVKDCSNITEADVNAVLPSFTGEIMQVPPMVSAVHYEGRRLYELARENRVVEREPRAVNVYSIRLNGFTPGGHPLADIDVTCSKGTYIRTLCADIGSALGCGGHMKSLLRTRVGNFRLEDAVNLEVLQEAASQGRESDYLVSMDEALDNMPSVELDSRNSVLIRNGVIVRYNAKIVDGLPVKIHDPDGTLIAIGRISGQGDEAVLRPDKVFSLDKDVTEKYG